MAHPVGSFWNAAVAAWLIGGLSGCAGLGLTTSAVAVSGGAAGVDYTLTNNAYKTFSYPIAEVRAALQKALRKMEIGETNSMQGEDKISISAATKDLNIDIDLEKVTPTVTKIEVSARKGVFFKDKSTAREIIVQTEKNLEVKK